MAGKTRVTVEIGGIAREMFSVEERKGGDLMVFLKASRSVATSAAAEHEDVLEQRFSVHVSPKSQGHTIKQTLRTSAEVTTTAALVLPRSWSVKLPTGLLLPPRPHFCWPIFMARPPRLDTGRYDSRPKNADRRIDIKPFEPQRASIVYMVIASSPDIIELPNIRRRISFVTLPFRAFNLHVLYGFSPVPSLPVGDFITFATSPQISGVQQTSNNRDPRVSLAPPAIEGAFFRGLTILRDRYGKQYVEMERTYADLEGAATIMWGLAAFCTAEPPQSGEDVIANMNEYFAEIAAMKASSGRIGLQGGVKLPDWLEERIRTASVRQRTADR